MPELPEVESTARFLNERIAGDTVRTVTVQWPRTVGDVRLFSERLLGAKIPEVFRRAKFVCFRCFDIAGAPFFVAAHMRMSGSFDVLSAATAQPDKHDRFVLTLESGKVVTFCDPRKFGRAQVVSDFEAFSAKLGIEPLSSEFTAHALAMRLARKRALKPLLLDQTVVAGLGNIYVDEALWYSGLHPLRVAHTVTPQEIRKLRTAIVSVLKRAIAKQGTDFGDGVVEMGSYRPVVYGRKGERCRRCRGEIQRIVVGQRGTHLCPVCQPRKRKSVRKN